MRRDIYGNPVSDLAMPADNGSAAPAETLPLLPIPHVDPALLASVTVVVTVYNHPRVVRPCLRSFHRHTHPSVRLLIVDDGSDAYTKRMLRDEMLAMSGSCLDTALQSDDGMTYEAVHETASAEMRAAMASIGHAGPRPVAIIGHPNIRYTKTINVGFKRAFADGSAWACALNSDILLTPGWLERMMAQVAGDDHAMIVCPYFSTVGSGDERNPLQVALQPGASYVDQADRIAACGGPGKVPAVMPVGAVMAVRKKAWDAFGPFDESIGTAGGIYGEENDFWAKVTHHGWTALTARDAFVYHESHATMGAGAGALEHSGYMDFRKRRLGHTTNGDWYDARHAESKRADPRMAIMRRVRRARVESGRLRVAFFHPGAHLCGGNLATVNVANQLIEYGIDASVAFNADRFGEWKLMPAHFGPIVSPTPADWIRAGGFEEGILVATDWRTGQFVRDICAKHRRILPAAFVQDREDWFKDRSGTPAFTSASDYAPYLDIARRRCVVNATWVRDSLVRDHGFSADRMRWIGIGTDPDMFYPRGPRDDAEGVRLIAMSRPQTPRRGNALLALMWMRLKERYGERVKLFTYGDAPDVALPSKHLGKLSQARLSVEFARAHVLLEPSLSQAWGMAAHEMMATGGTVVSHDNAGIHHYAEHDVSALIAPGRPDGTQDHDAVFELLCRAVDDAALRNRIGEAARSAACAFSWESVGGEWAEQVASWGTLLNP